MSRLTKPHFAFLLIAAVFGLLSLIYVAPLSQTDSGGHFLRAYTLAQGELSCPVSTSAPSSLATKIDNQRYFEYSFDLSEPVSEEIQEEISCHFGNYSPILYLPQIVGVKIAQLTVNSIGSLVYFASFFSLLFYIFSMFFLIKRLKVGKWVLFILALMPQMLHLAPSFSPDSVNNVAIASIVVFMLNIFSTNKPLNNKQLCAIILIGFISALTKANNIFLLFPLIFLSKTRFKPNPQSLSKIPFNLQKWGIGALAGLVYVVVMNLWMSISARVLINYSETVENPLLTHPQRILRILYNTFLGDFSETFYRSAFGTFSTYQYKLTILPICVLVVLLLLAFFVYPKDELEHIRQLPKRSGLIFGGTFVLFVAVLSYIMYTSWALLSIGADVDYIDGLQGRYFTISLLLLVPVGISLSRFVSIKLSGEKLLTVGVPVVMSLILLLYIFQSVNYTNGYTSENYQQSRVKIEQRFAAEDEANNVN